MQLNLTNYARHPSESFAPWAWRGLRFAWMQFDGNARRQTELIYGGNFEVIHSAPYPPRVQYGPEGALLDFSTNRYTYLSFGQRAEYCPTDQISVVCRVLVTSELAANQVLAAKGTPLSTHDWMIARRTTNAYEFAIVNTGDTKTSTQYQGARYVGGVFPRMVTFVLTYDGSRLKGYGDGVLFYDMAATGQIRNTAGYEISLGRSAGSSGRFGYSKLLQIYDRSLSAEEICYLSHLPYDFLRRREVQPYWVLSGVPDGVFNPFEGSVFTSMRFRSSSIG